MSLKPEILLALQTRGHFKKGFWSPVKPLQLTTCPPCGHHVSVAPENLSGHVAFFFCVQTIRVWGMKWQQLPHCPACSGNLDIVRCWVPFPDIWVSFHPSVCWNDFPRACSSCNPSASPLFPLFCLCLKNDVICAQKYLSAICLQIFNFKSHWLGFGVFFDFLNYFLI